MYSVYLIIVLGLLSAFGPFVIDMYLPAMPEMTRVFSTSVSSVQLGLTFCMVGLAVGQIIFGPLSDRYGRKPVLYFSLLLYIAATLFCCLSQDIDTFNFARLLQGLGGAGAIVYSRSAPTDLYSGKKLAKIIAIVGAVNGIAPVAAPVIGGSVADLIGWRGIFYILLGIGVVITGLVIPVKETLPKEAREQGSFWRSFEGFALVCKVLNFAVFTTVFGLGMGALFAYISSTPFILQNEYGLSQFHFSLIFALNAVAIGAGALLAVRFSTTAKATYFGTAGSLIASIAGFIFALTTKDLYTYEGCLLLMVFCLGFIFTGAASAIIGSIGFLLGGIVSPIVSLGNIQATSFAVCTVALGLGFVAVLHHRNSRHTCEEDSSVLMKQMFAPARRFHRCLSTSLFTKKRLDVCLSHPRSTLSFTNSSYLQAKRFKSAIEAFGVPFNFRMERFNHHRSHGNTVGIRYHALN